MQPRRQDTFDMQDGSANYAGASDSEEHSVLEDSDNEDQEDEFMDDDDDGSSSLSIPNESIDFDLVYSLHSFAATVEGQANVVKGDSLFLMDDSNSYWWLVRVLKTQEVGYIPAENIETPFERLARLNKHRNVDLASATQAELETDVSRIRQGLDQAPANAPRVGNTVRNPMIQRRSLAFSAALNVHRYPPAVWNEEEWLIEREERRAASMHEREQDGDYDMDDMTFDDDEDHEEGEWDVGNFEAEDRDLAEERQQVESNLAREAQRAPPAPVAAAATPQPPPPSLPDESMNWEDTAPRQRSTPDPVAVQQPPLRTARSAERMVVDPMESTETRKVSVTPSIARGDDIQDSERERERKREREQEEEAARKRNKPATPVQELRPAQQQQQQQQPQQQQQQQQQQAAPVSSAKSTPASNGGGKLRKEREPPSEDDGKKKKGGVFSIFSRKNSTKEKGKNSSIGSENDLNGRISDEAGRRPSNGGSGDGMSSPTTATAMQQQQQQQASNLRNSTDPKRIQQMQQQQQNSPQANAASQLRQRDQQQQALYQQQYLSRTPSSPPEVSYGLQSASAYMGSSQMSSAPSSFHSPASGGRQRPGSLILTPSSTNDGIGVPELSVIRVFAGQNLQTDATFKTVLLNSSTTSEDLIKQAVQRFRLDDLDPDEYFLTVKQVEGSSAILRSNERPLVVFEGLVESAPRVKRSSVGSVSSVSSNLSMHPAIKKLDMNDFTDDSVVKFYLNRKGGDDSANEYDGADDTMVAETAEGDPDSASPEASGRQRFLTVSTSGGNDVQPERFTSPSFRFPLQLVVYPEDLPDDMVFDPMTEAIIFKDTLRERGRPTGASPGVSLNVRRKVFIFPKNVTVAEVIETGLERFGIEEGVVDGGDEVEDKVSKRKSALRVRYGLSVDNGMGKERELTPTSRVIDAYLRPPAFRTAQTSMPNKRRSIDSAQLLGNADDVSPGDPTFILRRATAYRSSATSKNRLSMGLDEIALQKLHRDSASSTTSSEPRSATNPGLSRAEIIAAQREATRANQKAILSASANSVRGMDVLLPGNAMIRSAYSGDEMRYSYVQPDGETYDISDIVQEEWQDTDSNKDVLQDVLGRNKDRIGEKLDRVLNKIQTNGPRQPAVAVGRRSASPDSQYSTDDRSRSVTPGSASLVSRTPIPAVRSNGQLSLGRPGTSTPTGAKPVSAVAGTVPGLAARRQPSVTSVATDDAGYATPMGQSPDSPLRTPTPKAPPPKRIHLTDDDFGVSHMMAVIQLRASSTPRKAPAPVDPVDEMLFGRQLEMNSLHPKVRDIYAGAFKYLDDTDKLLDDFMAKRKAPS
ncbi:Heat shock protein [Mycena chlorophos]|uniref:Heat shock protein n=1 Tax=Mycena chlorophos TaxID=658473 RepID=A0A8H6TAH8_MYCCL|nr:Heat shock protein [Mycena chlorophos]